jgi:hypothetical protein
MRSTSFHFFHESRRSYDRLHEFEELQHRVLFREEYLSLQAGLPLGVRKSAMMLICKILALSSPALINEIVNAPAESSRETIAQKAVRVFEVDGGDGNLVSTPNRLDTARPAAVSVEDSSKSAPRDGRLFVTPDSRERVNGSDRIRSRNRKCGLVSLQIRMFVANGA